MQTIPFISVIQLLQIFTFVVSPGATFTTHPIQTTATTTTSANVFKNYSDIMASCDNDSNNNNNNKKACVPCSSLDKSSLLTADDVNHRLASTPSLALWKQEKNNTNNCNKITCHFVAKTFQAALDAINAMGVIAEREGHHPDFHLTNYREVQIDVYTHSVNGITENDIVLAQMLAEEVKVIYSPKWLKEHPEVASDSFLRLVK